jgi:hypothetical protein
VRKNKQAQSLSFSISRFPFFICHCLRAARKTMTNEKSKMENGKWNYQIVFAWLSGLASDKWVMSVFRTSA